MSARPLPKVLPKMRLVKITRVANRGLAVTNSMEQRFS